MNVLEKDCFTIACFGINSSQFRGRNNWKSISNQKLFSTIENSIEKLLAIYNKDKEDKVQFLVPIQTGFSQMLTEKLISFRDDKGYNFKIIFCGNFGDDGIWFFNDDACKRYDKQKRLVDSCIPIHTLYNLGSFCDCTETHLVRDISMLDHCNVCFFCSYLGSKTNSVALAMQHAFKRFEKVYNLSPFTLELQEVTENYCNSIYDFRHKKI